MKKILYPAALRRLVPALLLGALPFAGTSCLNNSDPVTPTQDYSTIDEGLIQQYITDQKITNAQRQPSGLYFVPDSVNTALPLITKGSTVSVLYTGQLLNGQVFDSNAKPGGRPFSFVVQSTPQQVITGWELGLPLMHKGDKARLLIPSALGYGPRDYGPIPANSVLVFTIRVKDVQ